LRRMGERVQRQGRPRETKQSPWSPMYLSDVERTSDPLQSFGEHAANYWLRPFSCCI
jgi:hypothetical protein